MMSNACGVDFGTSNSTVGWLRPDAPTLLPLEDGKATLPSVIFFHAEDPTVSYGRAALADYLAGYEGRLMRSLKSLLGTSMMDDSTEVMGQAMPFRKLLAHFIGELKRRAERAAGHEFRRAVLGRPVFFIDEDPKADQLAEDTLAVARFDFVTLVFIALVCAGLMLLLALGFGLPAGWSVGIGLAVGVVWGMWRYFRLVRER